MCASAGEAGDVGDASEDSEAGDTGDASDAGDAGEAGDELREYFKRARQQAACQMTRTLTYERGKNGLYK